MFFRSILEDFFRWISVENSGLILDGIDEIIKTKMDEENNVICDEKNNISGRNMYNYYMYNN